MAYAPRSRNRNVFGTTFKRDYCYENIKASESTWDGNFIKANTQYFAVAWQVGGGGAFAVVPHSEVGRRDNTPLFTGHSRPVLDFDFHPFNESIIASGSEDFSVKIWSIPEGGPKSNIEQPLVSLTQHQKKVGFVLFHPSAANVLATAGMDPCVKIWDIEKAEDKTTLNGFKDLILSIDWHRDGNLLGSSCKDKKLRVFDPRTGAVSMEADGHQGPKSSRFVFLRDNRAFSVGYSPKSDRQYMVWDVRNFTAPVLTETLDTDTGLPMVNFDYDSGILFIGGKGEATIKYMDTNLDKPLMINTFVGPTQQRGLCMCPKRMLDVSHCEVVRMLKLTRANTVEPIRFENPRREEAFQEDLFPDTAGPEPALTADEWFGGRDASPKLVSLNPDVAQTKAFVPYSFTPTPTPPVSAASAASKPVSGGSDSGATSAAASAVEELAAARRRIAELEAALADSEAVNAKLSAELAALKTE